MPDPVVEEEEEKDAAVGDAIASKAQTEDVSSAPEEEIVHAEETVPAETAIEAVLQTEAASESSEVAPPAKRLTRVTRAWEMDNNGAQLSVQEGDFVCVWLSTVTEHGWIYAEDVLHAEKAGWLPGCVLQELSEGERWMRAKSSMEAVHETQLSVTEGSVYKVHVNTRTDEGWTYAEDSDTEKAGWVPAFCLEWSADLEE